MMQVWIRQAEFEEWVNEGGYDYFEDLSASSWVVKANGFCRLCNMFFDGEIAKRADYMELDRTKLVLIEQVCSCTPFIAIKGDEIVSHNHLFFSYIPMQFIELSPYDNYSFQE